MGRSYTFTVTIKVNATPTEAREYIEEAIGTWGGQYHTSDPFFPPNIKVKVLQNKVKIQPIKNICRNLRHKGLTFKEIADICSISTPSVARYCKEIEDE